MSISGAFYIENHITCWPKTWESKTNENPNEPSQKNTTDAEGFLSSTFHRLFWTIIFCIVVVEIDIISIC